MRRKTIRTRTTRKINVGTVVGSTSPSEFRFHLKRFEAKLGDLVTADIEIPSETGSSKIEVTVWGRITELSRFNPFLPAEATVELADEGLTLTDTVLSNTRDQVEGRVLVLGRTSSNDYSVLVPLNYPVQPGAVVQMPKPADIRRILIGDDERVHRLEIGTLIGRQDVSVALKTNIIVARHMAILAMTGGGKTVAARRIIRELLDQNYPLVILDPHGDYLGLWEKRVLFRDKRINLYFPSLKVNNQNLGLVAYLVSQMTQGLTDAQKEKFHEALDRIEIKADKELSVTNFIDLLLQKLTELSAQHRGTIPAIRRGLNMVRTRIGAMELANEKLRQRLSQYEWQPMPDPLTAPELFVRPGQASIVYLGGYDHLTQSTIVALVLQHLFDKRASMANAIPPFLTIVEEAHNFIPSRGEGQMDTPSVEIIRKVITEGRKFGVGLLLVSQRPSRLDETTLSQCNTFLVFRLVNPRDQAFVEKVMENLSRSDSKLLPGFGPGEGIVSGQAVRFPLLVRVKFDADLVPQGIGDEDFLSAVAEWTDSTQAEAVERGDSFENDLDGLN